MTRDEVLAKLRETRGEFDRLLSAIPAEKLTAAIPGSPHSPRDLVYHIAAYDDLVVRRLRAARDGDLTEFDRDRVSWEAFNERIWAEAGSREPHAVLAHASKTFLDLIDEVEALTDEELSSTTGVTAGIDPAWLRGQTLGELIGVDCFEHYPMHFAQLVAAAQAR